MWSDKNPLALDASGFRSGVGTANNNESSLITDDILNGQ